MAHSSAATTQPAGRIFLWAIFGLIIIGTVLLHTPWAQVISHSFLDNLFTATSASCVTGLLTVPLAEYTLFGHIIILILIQLGGLGLITASVFLMSLFVRVKMKTNLLAASLLEIGDIFTGKRFIAFIILFTFGMEAGGAFMLYPVMQQAGSPYPLFDALFHSVSFFCSAGIVRTYALDIGILDSNALFLLTTIILMLVGHLGFFTWQEIGEEFIDWYHERQRRIRFSLQTYISLRYTAIIIAGGFVLLYLFLNTSNDGHSLIIKFLHNLFHACSYRGTGFSFSAMQPLPHATMLIIMVLSIIGAAAGSTGSGLKLTTIAILFANVRATITGRDWLEINGRKLIDEQIYKGISIFFMSILWILITTFILLIAYQEYSLMDTLFESISAFTNLGLSRGITSQVGSIGKLVLMSSMLAGRIGALTLLLSLKKNKEKREFNYPEERVLLN